MNISSNLTVQGSSSMQGQLDMTKKQIVNQALHNSATPPDTPVNGQIYLDTSNLSNCTVKYWNAANVARWITLATTEHDHIGVYQPIDGDLTAIAALASTGYLVRTGTDTYATRTFSATNISDASLAPLSVANGTGVSGNTQYSLDVSKIHLPSLNGTLPISKGGTNLSSPIADNSVLSSDGTAYVGKSLNGTTNQVNVVHNAGSIVLSTPQDISTASSPTFAKVTVSAAPVASTDLANKAYVDAMASGLVPKTAAKVKTTGNIVMTSAAASQSASLDGVTTWSGGDRLLLASQTNSVENGIYFYSTSSPFFQRASDMDEWNEFKSAYVFITEGTVNASSGWYCNTPVSGSTILANTWVLFSKAGQIEAGNGLTKSGQTLDVGAGLGVNVAADSISIKTSNTTPCLTLDSSGLAVQVVGAGGLLATSSGLQVDFVNKVVEKILVSALYTSPAAAGTYTIVINNYRSFLDILPEVIIGRKVGTTSAYERIYMDIMYDSPTQVTLTYTKTSTSVEYYKITMMG